MTRRRLTQMSGQGSVGPCALCGRIVEANGAFVNVGPTNWNDPEAPKARRWVAPHTEIHGWTPFVVTPPECFAREEGAEALEALIAAALPQTEPPA